MSSAEIPGMELVDKGIADLRAGNETVESLLVEAAAPRLRFIGLDVPPPARSSERDAEIRLYERLGAAGYADPYREYNSLLRRLASCCRALEAKVFRQRRAAGR